MALPKRHWGNAAQSPGFVPDAACGRSGVREIITTSARAFVSVSRNTTWYCSDCAKAARLALAAESAPKPDPRSDSERYAELRKLVEAWQSAYHQNDKAQTKDHPITEGWLKHWLHFCDTQKPLLDWSHR